MNEEPGRESKGKAGKGGLLPWLIGAGVALGGWYFYDKKKKAQALERQRQAELLRRQQERENGGPGQARTSAEKLPLQGFSASDRLRDMGVDVNKPRYRQPGDLYGG